MTPPATAPSAVGSDDYGDGARSMSVATSRAGGPGSESHGGWASPPQTVDGIADGGEGDGKTSSSTQEQQQQRRPSVPPLPLTKLEGATSTRRRNSFVAKLVASWQFAQRKRLRRQGEEERVFAFFA